MGDIGVLFKEPDNFARVLLYLNPKDLASAELVCREWRDFIHHNNIWRKKLISNASSIPEWFEGLDKFPDWSKQNSVQLSRLQIKALFHTLHSTTVSGFNNANLIATEKFHFERNVGRIREGILRGSEVPKQSGNKQLYRLVTHGNPCMSYLAVFGPRAYPIALFDEKKPLSVAVAVSHYGKGRVVVFGHEDILQNKKLMQSAALWVSGGDSKTTPNTQVNQPTIMLDPHSKMWTAAGWADNNPWDRMVNPFDDSSLVPRSQLKRVGAILSSHNQQEAVNGVVYVTQGHSDEDIDVLLDFVKNGGGLIVAGHSWWWAHKKREEAGGNPNVLLDHPGNKLINHFGIAFSRMTSSQKTMTDCPPSLNSHWRWRLREKQRYYHPECQDLFNSKEMAVTERQDLQSIVKMFCKRWEPAF